MNTEHEPDRRTSAAADLELDMRGRECPWPIVETRRALGSLQPGQRVRVLCTDPHSRIDFKAFCARTGHALVVCRDEGDGLYEYEVQKRAD